MFLSVFESRRYNHLKPKDCIEEAVQLLSMISWLEEHIRLENSNLQYLIHSNRISTLCIGLKILVLIDELKSYPAG